MPKVFAHFSFSLLCFCLLASTACTKRQTLQEQDLAPEVPITQSSVEAQMASFIGTAPEGTSQTFSNTRYGTATVTIGRSYHSALDIPCREAYIRGASRTKTAACQDKKQGWILAPDIMGDGAL